MPGKEKLALPPKEQKLLNPWKGKMHRVSIVETSEAIEQKARDVADAGMTAEKGKAGFFSRIWKHNLFKEYYRQKGIRRAKERIGEGQTANLYAEEGTAGQVKHDITKSDIAERFASELGDEDVKHEGEIRENLGDSKEQQAVKTALKKLVADYVEGKVPDRDAFNAEKYRIFARLRNARSDVFDSGKMYADNLTEVAESLKASFGHPDALPELDFDLDVIIGKAKAGVRTEAQFNAVDKIVDKIQRSLPGKFLANEAVISSAVAAAFSIGSFGLRRVLSSKTAAFLSFGGSALVGGGVAALREAKMVEEDRRQHFREMAQGKSFDAAKAPRRAEMNEFKYDVKSADSLFKDVRDALLEDGEKLTSDRARLAILAIAEIDSRITLSDEKKIDLIGYSSEEKVEGERNDLDYIRALGKMRLQQYADSAEGADFKATLGKRSVRDVVKDIAKLRQVNLEGTPGGITAQNELFSKLKLRKSLKAGVKGIGIGLAAGLLFQEGLAFLKSDQEGLLEHHENLPIGKDHVTSLEALRRWLTGDIPSPGMPTHEAIVGANHFKLPDGIDLVDKHDGTFALTANGVALKDHLTFNPDGSLTAATRAEFDSLGIKTTDIIRHGVGHAAGVEAPKDFLAAHHNTEPIHHITRTWEDNDTAKIFEENELRQWWGGTNNTGIDASGNYVMNIGQMTPDGSFHAGLPVDAQKIFQDGHMKLLLSLSKDTQSQVFEVPFDAHGNAIIDPNSEVAKLLFRNVNGHAVFLGAHAEVGNVMGFVKDAHGNLREAVDVFATHSGDGLKEIGSTVDTVTTFHDTIVETPVDWDFELPPVIVAPPRTPLEPTGKKRPEPAKQGPSPEPQSPSPRKALGEPEPTKRLAGVVGGRLKKPGETPEAPKNLKKRESIDTTKLIIVRKGERLEIAGGIKAAHVVVEEGGELVVSGDVSDAAMIRARKGSKVKIKNIKDSIVVADEGSDVEFDNDVENIFLYKSKKSNVKGSAVKNHARRLNHLVEQVNGSLEQTAYNEIRKNRRKIIQDRIKENYA